MAETQAVAPTSIKSYLEALKVCLRGQPPALIQDALADAEEYLRAEQAQSPEEPEAQVLVRVIETYGAPQEVAEEYIAMEQAVGSPFPARADEAEASDSGPGLFGVLVDPRAYGALIYMLLSLATGIFYFTWAVTGVSLTLGLAILIIGIPFALLFIGSIRVISWVEGRVVEALLGVRMPRRLPTQEEGGTLWTRIKRVLGDARTWSSLIYMLLQLPLGVIYFTLAVTLGATSGSVIAGGFYELTTGKNVVRLDTYPELDALLNTPAGLVGVMIVGFVGILFMLHLARVVGFIHGKIAEALLVRA
ncbi:MAG: sensor domain-containing protein [Alphaproteobacteria bacterium]|nr:sensor domain-containing protein [Alphaproteobacteria bacterium]